MHVLRLRGRHVHDLQVPRSLDGVREWSYDLLGELTESVCMVVLACARSGVQKDTTAHAFIVP